jgi:nitrite reductase/ring-hydroxylating ferredoxin subunit
MAAGERLICAAGDLVDGGSGYRFEVLRGGLPVPAFALRFRGRVYAYLNQCAHIPVELDCRPGQFFDTSGLYLMCSTHGATYAPESGACVFGRCDRQGLTAVKVVERDGSIYLNDDE